MPEAPLSISVAMATYNGERFLREQLESLANQTRLPAELVVRDDCSTDRTVALVEEFASSVPFSVRIIRAPSNTGYVRGFLEAGYACTAELVAFSDQDDIWVPEKLERCAAEFERAKEVTLVVHSGLVVGDMRRGVSRSFPDHRRRSVTTPTSTPLMPTNPGFAIVAARWLLDIWNILEEPPVELFGATSWGHDNWTAFVAIALGEVVWMPEKLVRYRQHDANAYGVHPTGIPSRARHSKDAIGSEIVAYRTAARWARNRVLLLRELERRARASSLAPDAKSGVNARIALWSHLAEVNDRRADFYEMRVPRFAALARLAKHTAKGDYRRRDEGGLGLSSLARDLARTAGAVDLVLNQLAGRPRSSR